MSERELLEKRAKELGLEVPEGVSDEELKVLLAAKNDRNDLEARAAELGIEEIKGMSGDELQALVDAAQERADLEARAKELGVEFGATIGDKNLKKRIKSAEAKLTTGSEPKGALTRAEAKGSLAQALQPAADEITVICAVGKGRRRAGRAWVGGENKVPVSEFTPEMAEALDADPMFQVKRPVAQAAD